MGVHITEPWAEIDCSLLTVFVSQLCLLWKASGHSLSHEYSWSFNSVPAAGLSMEEAFANFNS